MAFFHAPLEKASLYWMVYLEMGLWLSAPRLHCSVTFFSVLFITRTPPGAPGGPGVRERARNDFDLTRRWCGCFTFSSICKDVFASVRLDSDRQQSLMD